ncbi:MAG: response regulator transcription factor [bacterium]|nr:response regulator transcription factor [bacterium]MDI1335495.1 response regulator transcription factor [Lacunisphaera sp.]
MPATTAISLLLVDGSELWRTGVKTSLSIRGRDKYFRIVGEADSIATAVTECGRLKPDLVLLETRLPDGSGFAACRQILAQRPDTRILILTSAIDEALIHDNMQSGVHGYLGKDISPTYLCQAIIDVAAGKFILDPAVTTQVFSLIRSGGSNPPTSDGDRLAILSAQERRVLALVAEGKTNKEVAGQMALSEKTVKNYLSNIFEKLKINRRAQAAVLYAESRNPKTASNGPSQ